MRDWELAEHFAERDGVRMSSGQHIDLPGEGPIPWEMVGRWDSLVAKNKRLREALRELAASARVAARRDDPPLEAWVRYLHADAVAISLLGEGE